MTFYCACQYDNTVDARLLLFVLYSIYFIYLKFSTDIKMRMRIKFIIIFITQQFSHHSVDVEGDKHNFKLAILQK